MKSVINRTAVRKAFHAQGARMPRGFLADVEQAVYVVLRRAAAGEIEPSQGLEADGESYLKQSLLKEAIRQAFGKRRADTAWVGHLNAVVVSKVSEASVRSGAKAGAGPKVLGVPVRILRAFLRSPESKAMTLSTFHRRWQEGEFRREWVAKSRYKGTFLKGLEVDA